VARARGRLQGTRDGQLKGKLAYLAPEQVHGDASRRSDLFTAGVVLWEALAGRQLFQGRNEADLLSQVLLCKVPALSEVGVDAPDLQRVLDRALAREPAERFATAAEMADAVEACGVASAGEVAAWVEDMAADVLAQRTTAVESLSQLPAPEVPAQAPVASGAPPRALLVGALLVAAVVLAAGAWRALDHRTSDTSPRSAPTVEPAPGPATPTSAATGPVDAQPPSGTPEAKPLPGPAASPLDAKPPLDTTTARSDVRPAPAPKTPTGAPSPPASDAKTPRSRPSPEPAAAPPADVPKPAEAPKSNAPCDPPFTIDASGVKRFKVECLK